MEEHLRQRPSSSRGFAGTLFGAFGIIGLLLATIGLLWRDELFRDAPAPREMGIRLALGAPARRPCSGLVVRQGMLLTAIAVGLGLPAGIGGGKVLQQLPLWRGGAPHDLATFLDRGRSCCLGIGARSLLDPRAACGAYRSASSTSLRIGGGDSE